MKENHKDQQKLLGNPNRERYRPFHQRVEGLHFGDPHLREVGGRFSFGLVAGTIMR